jgi:hypothetical protein
LVFVIGITTTLIAVLKFLKTNWKEKQT